jgi:hypothetical protein
MDFLGHLSAESLRDNTLVHGERSRVQKAINCAVISAPDFQYITGWNDYQRKSKNSSALRIVRMRNQRIYFWRFHRK